MSKQKMIPKPSTSARSVQQIEALEAYETEHNPDTFDHKYNIGDIVWVYDTGEDSNGSLYPFITKGHITQIVKGIYGYVKEPGYEVEGELWYSEGSLFSNSAEPMKMLEDGWQNI
jgi:hypothetical protein